MKSKTKEFSVLIERDSEGYFVASVPALRGCHSQAKSLDKLMERVREAIELCLEVETEPYVCGDFVGVQRVVIWRCLNYRSLKAKSSSEFLRCMDSLLFASRVATIFFGTMMVGALWFLCILEKFLDQGCSFKFWKILNSINQICQLSKPLQGIKNMIYHASILLNHGLHGYERKGSNSQQARQSFFMLTHSYLRTFAPYTFNL